MKKKLLGSSVFKNFIFAPNSKANRSHSMLMTNSTTLQGIGLQTCTCATIIKQICDSHSPNQNFFEDTFVSHPGGSNEQFGTHEKLSWGGGGGGVQGNLNWMPGYLDLISRIIVSGYSHSYVNIL